MKTLQQHINEKLYHQQVDEKLVINKGLKGCNYKKQNKKDILNAYFNLVEIIEEHSNMNIMVSLGYGTYDNDTPHMQAKFENEDLYEEGLPTIHNKYEYMLEMAYRNTNSKMGEIVDNIFANINDDEYDIVQENKFGDKKYTCYIYRIYSEGIEKIINELNNII